MAAGHACASLRMAGGDTMKWTNHWRPLAGILGFGALSLTRAEAIDYFPDPPPGCDAVYPSGWQVSVDAKATDSSRWTVHYGIGNPGAVITSVDVVDGGSLEEHTLDESESEYQAVLVLVPSAGTKQVTVALSVMCRGDGPTIRHLVVTADSAFAFPGRLLVTTD